MPHRCTFCGPPTSSKWALTACNGDPADLASWRREILPVCALGAVACYVKPGASLKLKRTGERWFGGHTVGRDCRPRVPLLQSNRPAERRVAYCGMV